MLSKGLDQLQGDIHLADTDRMNPDATGIAELFHDPITVNGEALAKFVAVFPAAEHSQEKSRQKHHEHHWKQNVVKDSNEGDHVLEK